MGLEDRLTDAVALAFENLGGDPVDAIRAAMNAKGLGAWVRQQTAQTAVVGGVEVSIPGLHGATLAAGTLYLLRKMARLSWGIAAYKNAYVLESAGYSDLRNILTLWAHEGEATEDTEDGQPDHRAIDLDLFVHVLDTPGRLQLYRATEALRSQPGSVPPVTARTLDALCDLCETYPANPQARALLAAVGGENKAEDADSAAARFADANAHRPAKPQRSHAPSHAARATVARTMGRKVSTKVARDVAVQLAARLPLRYLSGFVPLAGAVINGAFNAQTLHSMANAAREYYDERLTLDEFHALPTG